MYWELNQAVFIFDLKEDLNPKSTSSSLMGQSNKDKQEFITLPLPLVRSFSSSYGFSSPYFLITVYIGSANTSQ
jgi:hypothetical protein